MLPEYPEVHAQRVEVALHSSGSPITPQSAQGSWWWGGCSYCFSYLSLIDLWIEMTVLRDIQILKYCGK